MNGPNSVSLAWNASTDNSSNWWYCVQRDGQGCFRVDPPQTTWTFPTLCPDTTFNYSVVALDSAGNRSAQQQHRHVHDAARHDAAEPAPGCGDGCRPTRISVAWTGSVDNTAQVWYTLLVNGSPYGADLIGSGSALVLDRSPSTTYTFKVTVRDDFGNTSRATW